MKLSHTLVGLALISVGCESEATSVDPAIATVMNVVRFQPGQATAVRFSVEDLRVVRNPHGEGVFVRCSREEFAGVQRSLAWWVLDGHVVPLNGPSKTATPECAWARDLDPEFVARSGLDAVDLTPRGLEACGFRR